jgi:hypothetical protein
MVEAFHTQLRLACLSQSGYMAWGDRRGRMHIDRNMRNSRCSRNKYNNLCTHVCASYIRVLSGASIQHFIAPNYIIIYIPHHVSNFPRRDVAPRKEVFGPRRLFIHPSAGAHHVLICATWPHQLAVPGASGCNMSSISSSSPRHPSIWCTIHV